MTRDESRREHAAKTGEGMRRAAHLANDRAVLAAYAKAVPEELRRADHCTGCGRCAPHCPQSINIPHEIAAIDEWIDGLKDQLVAK